MSEAPEEEPPSGACASVADPRTGSSRLSGITIGLLAVTIVLGATLRFWGIGWSLPDSRHPLSTYHPDERVNYVATRPINVFAGKFDIGYYNYGTLYFYLVDVAQTIGRAYGAIPSTPDRSADSPRLTRLEEATRQLPETRREYLAGRLVSVMLGIMTIPVVFALGKRLYGDSVGLISALLYAVAPLAVINAHFYTVDVSATLFVALALLWSARLLESQEWKNYLVAGAFTGLAAATKYTTGLVIVAPIAAHFIVSNRTSKSKSPLTGIAILLGAATIAFLIACPGPLINWGAFWDGLTAWPNSGVRYELFEHPRLGHGLLFVNTGPGWWYHLVISLRYGLGMPMLALLAAGILTAIRKGAEQDRLMLWFVVLFYAVTGLSGVRFARYLIPLYPAFCLLAARLVLELKPRSILLYSTQAAMALIVLLTAGYSTSLVHAMAQKDPRDAAADYLESQAAQGSTVAFAKTPWYFSPPLSPWFGELSASMRAKGAESTRFRMLLPSEQSEFDTRVLTFEPDYIVISNIETINELRLNQPAPKKFLSAIPRSYKLVVFDPPHIFNMAFSSTSTGLVPDDLLYIIPKLKVYEKR